MWKTRKYLKPYILFLVLGIVMLFGQVMLELRLPAIMSEIVDTGIQQSGVTDIAPRAISDENLALMQLFMSEDEIKLVGEHYAQSSVASDEFPNASEATLYLSEVDEATKAQIDSAFTNASYALITAVQNVGAQMPEDMQAQPESENTSAEGATAEIDLALLRETLMPVYAISSSQNPMRVAIDEAITIAQNTDELIKGPTASIFTIAMYEELGADLSAMQTSYIFTQGATMLFVCIFILVFAFGAGYCLSKLGAGVARDMRLDIFKRVSTFTNKEMDKFSTASLITRTTNDITQVQSFYTMGLKILCYAPLMGIGGLIMALNQAVEMSWIIALAIGVLIAIIASLFIIAIPRFKKMQILIDKLNLVSRENLSGMMVIRAFATQDFEEKRFDVANKDLTANTLFVSRVMVVLMPAMMLLMNITMLLVVWAGADLISMSQMQVGEMMAFMQYALQVIMAFFFVSMIFIMLPRATVSAERINEVVTTPTSVLDPTNPKTLDKTTKGEIVFNNVSFKYHGAKENVLENVSFTAKPGQTTAFIGSTGSGKSTLINLIPRFYDTTDGDVTIDGVNVKDITQKNLRDLVGYVPQKGMLFSGTVKSNVLYSDENAGDDVMQKAAEIAQATEFIEKLDDKYENTISQGGTNVSGGQRQRLSIARALAKKAPIYIFDDTFSALDFKTDAKLRKALKGYTENATVLIVAQRVSTIMGAEQIVVLNDGKIAGIGTHKELLANCVTYREIAESQLSKEELE